MRIGTWNVEFANKARNPDRLAKLLEKDADIWVLTETHRDLNLSNAQYSPVMSEPRPQNAKAQDGSTWVTIWSRFPMIRRLNVPDPLRMVAAIFDAPLGPLTVSGVVLPWFSDIGDKPAHPPPSNWDEFRRVLREELPLLLLELRTQSDGAHIVLAGDFNCDLALPYNTGLAAEREHLKSVLETAALVCHTAKMPYPPTSSLRMLIDHVCTDLGPAVSIETWSGEDGIRPRLSDHPGVVVSWVKQRENPTTFVSVNEIRIQAYYLWEKAGKPAGDGVPFWLEAERNFKKKT